MFISKLYVKNYKSIKEETFYFSKGINILVGKNNVGKSNVVSAIDEVLGEKIIKNYDNKVLYKNLDGKEASEMLIYIKIEDINEKLDFSLINTIKRSIAIIDVSCLSNEEFWGSDLIKGDSDLIKEKYNSYQTYWDINKLKEILNDTNSICLYRYVNKDIDTNVYSMLLQTSSNIYRLVYVNSNIKATLISSLLIPAFRAPENILKLNEWTWYGKLLKQEWNRCCSETDKKDIDEASKNLRLIIENIYKDLKVDINSQLKETLSLMNVEIGLNMMETHKEDYYKTVKLSANDGIETMIESKGCGLQSLIVIELFKFYTKVFNKSSVLIIEEPELYLHPQARRMLSDIFINFVKLGEYENQVILTTHSSEFVHNVEIENINVIKKEEGATKVYRINKEKYDVKELQKLRVELQHKNTEMFFAEKVILVEGEEVVLIPSMVKTLYKRNELNINDISVIKVGGKSYFPIYRKILNDLDIKNYIIADYDIISFGLDQLLIEEELEKLNVLKTRISSELKKTKDIEKICKDSKDWDALIKIIDVMIKDKLYNENIENYWDKFKNKIHKKMQIKDLESDLQNEVKKFINGLYDFSIFIMKKGELEDYYKKDKFTDEITQLSKGLKPYKIVELAEDKIDEYLDISEYNEIFDKILND